MSGSSEYEKYLNEILEKVNNLQVDWLLNEPYNSLPTTPKKLLWASTDEEDLFKSLQYRKDDRINEFLKDKAYYQKGGKMKSKIDFTLDYYTKNPISYNLNSYQFRSDEFSSNESGNVFLGCSDTFGVGQLWEHTWPYILSKMAFPNDKIYNLGVPGAGSDTPFRILNSLKDKIKIKNIFHWLPTRHRYEIYMGNDLIKPKDLLNEIKINVNGIDKVYGRGFTQIYPQHEATYSGLFANEYIANCLSTNTMLALTDLKNILAIKSIANSLGVNYYVANNDVHIGKYNESTYGSVYGYLKENNIPNLLARDLSHPEIIDNAKLVGNFLTALNDKKDG